MNNTTQFPRHPRALFLPVLSLFLLLTLTSCSHTPAPPTVAEASDIPSAEIAPAPETTPAAPATGPTKIPADAIARIREEGLNHSQVMATLSYLSDVIGPRLTGSPNLKRANEWTRDQFTKWGLSNAHMEAWGPFGRGWSLKRFSAQVVEPQDIPLIAFPKAWSPGFDKAITADVIYIEAKTEKDLEKYKGKLKSAIVLYSAPREVQARFDPMALRVADAELLKLANSQGGEPPPPGIVRANTGSERRELLAPANANRELLAPVGTPGASPAPTTKPATQPARGPATRPTDLVRVLPRFLAAEGAAMLVTPSSQGDGGTFFVAQASVPTTQPFRRGGPPGPQPWSSNAPAMLPQMTVAVEHYNRLVRMIQAGEKLKMNVDLQVQYHTADQMAYNTIAEIPGSDLKDEIVMIGAHMDSWHSGTGATDNGAGVAATMEAVRIIKAMKLQPRRTIRIGLWTGEEEGLLGSKAYVAKHFGKFEEATTRPDTVVFRGFSGSRFPSSTSSSSSADPTRIEVPATRATTRPTTRPARKFIAGPEYDHLAGYFNLDNGAGKIRGVYLQGNEAVRPIFRHWLAPFADLGAETITLADTGGTDHLSFDSIGLPGFQFIQDPLEYWSRTHHSNQDVFDRVPAEDMKQSSTILATFIYDAAMADEKLPRKPMPQGR